MKKSILKVMILVFLIIGSIYQTGLLWFEDVSDRNFFYNFIEYDSYINNISSNKSKYIISPKAVALFLGDSEKEYTVIKRTSKEYDNIYNEVIKLLKSTFDNGKYINSDIHEDELWSKRSLLIDLNFSLSNNILTNGVGSNSVSSDFGSISQIYIVPASLLDDEVNIYLIEKDTNLIHRYLIDKNSISDINLNINSYLTQFEGKETAKYISTLKDNIGFFSNNILLPLPSDYLLYKEDVFFQIPFINNNNFVKDSLEQYINGFFLNPAIKWTLEKDDEMRYGDDNIILKYNSKGIVEYNLIVDSSGSEQNISDAYNVANKFLDKDSKISEQEYYLESFSIEEGSITFYYSYGYDDFPLVMSQEIKDYNRMNYPMVIRVSDNKVVYYKRCLLAQQEIFHQRQRFKGKFESAIDIFVEENDVQLDSIDNMFLGYYWDNNKEYASLKWIIEEDSKQYIIDIE